VRLFPILIVLGLALTLSSLVLFSWPAPEQPYSIFPPEEPVIYNDTSPSDAEIMLANYLRAKSEWDAEWAEYSDSMDTYTIALELNVYMWRIGFVILILAVIVYVKEKSTKTPLEEYNEAQCRHCGKWIKRSWRTCPFCEKDQ
jgi:uncharacterized membrane protein